MAKKKLKINTKLLHTPSPEDAKEQLNLVKGIKTYPRSYRWREYDVELMENLIEKVNSGSHRRFGSTQVIRGALYLAESLDSETLFDAILEAEKQSLISRVK